MSLTTKILLNKSRCKNDGSYPLIIRLTYNRKIINFPLGYSLPEQDWNAKHQRVKASSKITSNVNRLNNFIRKREAQIFDAITKLEDDDRIHGLSTKEIKKLVKGANTMGANNVFSFINDTIAELRKARQFGNAEVYNALLNKLRHYAPDEKLSFEEVDYNFLKRMEVEHYSKGNEAGGLSVYLRTLRAVYNRAIKAGVSNAGRYPFKDYKIKNGTPNRKALTHEEFETFKQVKLKEGSPQAEARKLFMACFYLRGINWRDLALLRVKNIQGDFERVSYVRQKTKNKHFSIKITPKLKEIMKSYLGDGYEADEFIFPILKKSVPENRYHDITTNKRKKLNRRLREISTEAGLPAFTIYTARHTYAMALKRHGTPTNVIQDSLGHRTEEMTQTYLDSFENSVVDEYDELIM